MVRRIKLKLLRSISLFGFLMALVLSSTAQDIQFSQFFASSMSLNPAFTGNTVQHRLIGIYRNQWPSIPKSFVSYSFSYDYHLSDQNSGLGIIFTQDKAGTGGLRYTNVGGLYSYYFNINRKLIMRFGTKLSFTSRNYDRSSLRFNDQIITGSPATVESLEAGVSYFDANAGVLLHSEKFWVGTALDHLTQPDQSLVGMETNLPLKFSLHGGYKFILVEENSSGEDGTSLTASANYKAQEKWDQLDIRGSINKNAFTFGLSYRGIPGFKKYKDGYSNNDAVVLLLGVQSNKMKIGYTYDITISKLVNNTGGAHEISIIYEWHKKRQRRKRFFVPCAKF